MTWMDTSLDQLLDMTSPCLSIQMQNYSIIQQLNVLLYNTLNSTLMYYIEIRQAISQ